MSDQQKSFESNIPEHLLQNETQGMQYLMKELSKNTQATEYLLRKREESGTKLDEISSKLKTVDEKVSYTNGKVAQVLRDVETMKKEDAEKQADWLEIKQIVTVKQFCQKYLFNRYALIGAGIFTIGFAKVMINSDLRELFFKLIGLG